MTAVKSYERRVQGLIKVHSGKSNSVQEQHGMDEVKKPFHKEVRYKLTLDGKQEQR